MANALLERCLSQFVVYLLWGY